MGSRPCVAFNMRLTVTWLLMAFMGVLEAHPQGSTAKEKIVSDIVNSLTGSKSSQSNSQRSLVEKGGGPVMNGTELMEAMKKVCKQDPKETLVLSDPTKQRDDEKMPCSDLISGKKRSRFWGINPFVQTWALGSVGPTVASMSWPTVVQPVVPAVQPVVPVVKPVVPVVPAVKPVVPVVPAVKPVVPAVGPVIAALRSKVMEEKGGGPVMNGTELMEAMKKVCKQDPKETLVLSDPTKQRDDEKMPCSDLNSGKKR